jgi:hypothetical protein
VTRIGAEQFDRRVLEKVLRGHQRPMQDLDDDDWRALDGPKVRRVAQLLGYDYERPLGANEAVAWPTC